jgi:hypothetical protein
MLSLKPLAIQKAHLAHDSKARTLRRLKQVPRPRLTIQRNVKRPGGVGGLGHSIY